MRRRNKLLFYDLIRILYLVGKCAGIMPIQGLLHRNSDRLRFSWRSPYFLFVFIPGLLLQTITLTVHLVNASYSGFSAKDMTGSAFAMSCYISAYFYWKMSVNFKSTIEKIEIIESILPPPHAVRAMRRKVYFVMFFYTFVGIADYFLYFVTIYKSVIKCPLKQEDSGLYLKSYFMVVYSFAFRILPFSYTLGVICQLAKTQILFYWIFNDAIFILSSIYLENKFLNYNRMIFSEKNHESIKHLNWVELQFQYTQLSKLVRIVDQGITPLICVNFATSMLFICQQLYSIMGYEHNIMIPEFKDCVPENSVESSLQYASLLLSTALLATRGLLVLFLPARLHTASRKPLRILGIVPDENYNREVKRFMNQVYHSKVALSGLELFYFTRETIIAVFGVLATYELVLFQMRPL